MKYVLLLILLLALNSVYSQDAGQNFFKYWVYRYRLDNWIQKGYHNFNDNCPPYQTTYGYSLPPSEARRPNDEILEVETNPKWYHYKHYRVHHGDGGQQLGWYIAMLSSEYKLLANQGLSTDSTLVELYYALQTFNRLDYIAENSPPYTSAFGFGGEEADCDLNGFFIRSDVKSGVNGSMHPSLSNMEFYKNLVLYSDKEPYTGYDDISSCWGTNTGCGNGPSMDQYTHMLLGLKSVVEFIPDYTFNLREAGTALPGNPANGRQFNVNLHTMAKDIARRIGNYFESVSYNFKYPRTNHPTSHSEYEIFCYPLRKAVEGITGERRLDVHDELANYGSFMVWQAMKYDPGLSALTQYNAAMIMNMAVVGDSWYLVTPLHFIPIIGRIFDSFAINVTNIHVNAYAKSPLTKQDIYPLFYQQFRGGINLYSRSFYENVLNIADCSGPRNFDKDLSDSPLDDWANNVGPKGWRAGANRYEKFTARNLKSSDPNPPRYHNGLDYMCLYNLYNLTIPDYQGRDDNNLNNDINIDLPWFNSQLNTWYGLQPDNPAYIYGFNYVNFNNHTASYNAKADFVSTKRGGIHWENTHFEHGSDLHHYIEEPFKCINHPNLLDRRISEECPTCLVLPEQEDTSFVRVDPNAPVRYYDLSQDFNLNIDSLLLDMRDNHGFTEAEIDSLVRGLGSIPLYHRMIEELNPFHGTNPLDSLVNNNQIRQEGNLKRIKNISVQHYPNPTDGGLILTLYLSDKTDILIELYNPTGGILNQFTRHNTFSAGIQELNLDLSGLASGFYLCKITLDGNEQRFIKVIKK